jgi:hypothetical protein
MWPFLTQMPEQHIVIAAGVEQRVGEHGQTGGVEVAAGKKTVIVGGSRQAHDQTIVLVEQGPVKDTVAAERVSDNAAERGTMLGLEGSLGCPNRHLREPTYLFAADASAPCLPDGLGADVSQGPRDGFARSAIGSDPSRLGALTARDRASPASLNDGDTSRDSLRHAEALVCCDQLVVCGESIGMPLGKLHDAAHTNIFEQLPLQAAAGARKKPQLAVADFS